MISSICNDSVKIINWNCPKYTQFYEIINKVFCFETKNRSIG